MGNCNTVTDLKTGVRFTVDYYNATIQNQHPSKENIVVQYEKKADNGESIKSDSQTVQFGQSNSIPSDSDVCSGCTYEVTVFTARKEHVVSWTLSGEMDGWTTGRLFLEFTKLSDWEDPVQKERKQREQEAREAQKQKEEVLREKKRAEQEAARYKDEVRRKEQEAARYKDEVRRKEAEAENWRARKAAERDAADKAEKEREKREQEKREADRATKAAQEKREADRATKAAQDAADKAEKAARDALKQKEEVERESKANEEMRQKELASLRKEMEENAAKHHEEMTAMNAQVDMEDPEALDRVQKKMQADYMEKVGKYLEEDRELCKKKPKFSVAVCGIGGQGKSTLINTLLGKEVTKEGEIDTTKGFELVHEGLATDWYDVEGNKKLQLLTNLKKLVNFKQMHAIVYVYSQRIDNSALEDMGVLIYLNIPFLVLRNQLNAAISGENWQKVVRDEMQKFLEKQQELKVKEVDWCMANLKTGYGVELLRKKMKDLGLKDIE